MNKLQNALWMRMILVTSVLSLFISTQELTDETSVGRNVGNTIALAINHAGFSIAEQLPETGNMFFSPMSISMALGMVYLGANGNTSTQMESALGYEMLNISGQTVHESMRQLCDDMQQQAIDSGYSLNIANALFSKIGCNLEEGFAEGVKNYYHGNVSSLDFGIHPEDATSFINNWTREKTMNKIEKLFDEPLPANTRLVLTNAIYFKGYWKIEFPERNTYNGSFYVKDEEQWKQVEMMSLAKTKFRYLNDEETEYKYLEMPYKGDHVSMLFALPWEFDQMADLKMNSDLLCRVRFRMAEIKLGNVHIPKFKLSYEMNLREILMAMGMKDAFSRWAANFTGISSDGDLYLAKVVHKAVIEVNEKGSEAAAASSAVAYTRMLAIHPDFVANHAFLFYIIDKSSGAILFSGRVANP